MSVATTIDEFSPSYDCGNLRAWGLAALYSDGDDDPLYALDDLFLDYHPELLQAYVAPSLIKSAAVDDPFPGLEPEDRPPMRYKFSSI